MDGSHYPSNVPIGTSASSYPSPAVAAAISPHQLQQHNGQLQQNGHLPPHTLPPLQPTNHSPAMQNLYASHPHTPRTPTTPNPPPSTSTMSSYPPPQTQGAGRGYPQMMANPYSQQPHQGYGNSMPQSSVSGSHQPIAPAPTATRPPILRPMPAGGVMSQPGMPSPYGQPPLMPHQQQSMLGDNEPPTHVVGSQGRRGILPSAPGRPPAPTGGANGKGTVIPQKDADGKFPCPHCTKTYLHAKHLKRHLLRHTGDRPYMCVLCRDTFSRSDILKRHFQKCSIRRGNPTGASHLSHPQAHVKKHQAAQAKAAQESEMNQMNGMNNMQGDNGVGMHHHPFTMMQQVDQMGNMTNDQNQLSRSSSMSRMDDSNRDRRSMTGGGSVYGAEGQTPMTSNIAPQLNYGMPQGQNGMMYPGPSQSQGQNVDWNTMFPSSGAQDPDTYVSSFPPPNLGQTQIATKPGPSSLETERPMGTPNDVNDRSLFFSNWGNAPTMHENPYYFLSSQVLNFFHPPGTAIASQMTGLNTFFSPANTKNFLENYTHFHVHFSVLHIPTFRIMEAYTGLIAAMCCVGACYSDQASPNNVRDTMNFLKTALERDSNLFSSGGRDEPKADFSGPTGNDKADIEKLQALMLMISLLTWNGTPVQRESARRLFPQVCNIARRLGLLNAAASTSLYSVLHQPDFSLENQNPGEFKWEMWVQQELRNRLMHLLYLSDVAYGLYFNDAPQFDSLELRIPLPADDAAWEANNATECAEALQLHGTDAVKSRNPDGSQRSKQPELHLALKALMDSSYQIHPGSTNLSGKFVLVHCLIAQIRRAYVDQTWNASNGVSTPLSNNDWVQKSGSEPGSGNASANNSGRATPVSGPSPQAYKAISTALEKFKANWDMDMAIQFPPSVQNPRRYGFSRDGIHFFWLAKYLLKNTRPADLQLPADQRFRQAIHLLKSVRAWVMNDGAIRGEELGSVGEIDRDYGVHDLTLDMASLFKPLPHLVDSGNDPPIKTEI